MSVEAITWASRLSLTSPLQRLVLMLAADRCDFDGAFSIDWENHREFLCVEAEDAEAAAWDLDAFRAFSEVRRLDSVGISAVLAMPLPERIPSPRSHVDRSAVFDRDGRECASCGETEDLQIDHIVPISRGGGDEIENLQVLCRPCNLSKGNKMPGDWKGRAGV